LPTNIAEKWNNVWAFRYMNVAEEWSIFVFCIMLHE
jgi:hypothetical protein